MNLVGVGVIWGVHWHCQSPLHSRQYSTIETSHLGHLFVVLVIEMV